ncbi:MAG: hypothetical protein EA398_14925 [Deltaproteobacteria bacterium]|nr:MAG: hypothetical protein EA398_14925 [Deltaproteobacteria bacterium]
MCGRYSLILSPDELADTFDATWDDAHPPEPTPQVAPTDIAPIVVLDPHHTTPGTSADAPDPSATDHHDSTASPPPARRLLRSASFGWQVPWQRSGRLLNARAEGVTHRRTFRDAVADPARRCLVPASGWFEWQRRGADRQPWHHRTGNRQPLAFAALLAPLPPPPTTQADLFGQTPPAPTHAFCILTRPSPPPLDRIHDRMPLVLDPAQATGWLECTVAQEDLALLLPRRILLVAEMVDPAMGNPRHRPPDLLTPRHDETLTWED